MFLRRFFAQPASKPPVKGNNFQSRYHKLNRETNGSFALIPERFTCNISMGLIDEVIFLDHSYSHPVDKTQYNLLVQQAKKQGQEKASDPIAITSPFTRDPIYPLPQTIVTQVSNQDLMVIDKLYTYFVNQINSPYNYAQRCKLSLAKAAFIQEQSFVHLSEQQLESLFMLISRALKLLTNKTHAALPTHDEVLSVYQKIDFIIRARLITLFNQEREQFIASLEHIERLKLILSNQTTAVDENLLNDITQQIAHADEAIHFLSDLYAAKRYEVIRTKLALISALEQFISVTTTSIERYWENTSEANQEIERVLDKELKLLKSLTQDLHTKLTPEERSELDQDRAAVQEQAKAGRKWLIPAVTGFSLPHQRLFTQHLAQQIKCNMLPPCPPRSLKP